MTGVIGMDVWGEKNWGVLVGPIDEMWDALGNCARICAVRGVV